MSVIDDVKHHVSEWIRKEGPSFVPAAYAAILELDERVRSLESHIHHTVNQDHVSTPVLPIKDQPDPVEEAIEEAREAIFNASRKFHATRGRIDMFSNEIRTILRNLVEVSRG